MEYLSTCGLVRTTCHRSYMWHRRDAILIQEGVHGGNGLSFGPVQRGQTVPGWGTWRRCRRKHRLVRMEQGRVRPNQHPDIGRGIQGHVVFLPPVYHRAVPFHPGFAGERRCRRVMLHVCEERLTRGTGSRVIQTPRREAFCTFGAGMPHVSCRRPGVIPAGMGAFKLGVGTIILERDKRWALIQEQINECAYQSMR